MRALSIFIALLVPALGPPIVAASTLDLGVVVIESDIAGADHDCPVDATPTTCPASWDTNGTATPGDDAISAVVFINEVHVDVYSESHLVPSEEVSVAPASFAVRHPIYRELNRTWPWLNDSRPDALKPIVGFESRPRWAGDEEWGIFVNLYPANFRQGWCWDICFVDNQTYGTFTEDEFRPFPYGLGYRQYTGDAIDTDFAMARKMYEVQTCGEMLERTPAPCETSAVRPVLHEAQAQYEGATPRVESKFQFNRTSVAVEPENTMTRSLAGLGVPFKASDSRGPVLGKAPHQPTPAPTVERNVPEATPLAMLAPQPQREADEPQEPPAVIQGAGSPKSPLLVVAMGVTSAIIALVAWSLYHRVGRANGLDQETRRRIFDALMAVPGQRPAELASRLGLGHNTVKYHLSRLEKWNMIRAGDGLRPRYFPVDSSARETRVAEAMAQPTVRVVHAAVLEQEEAALSQIAGTLGLSVPTVRRAVDRLEAAGLATSARVGFRVIVRPVRTDVAGASHATAVG